MNITEVRIKLTDDPDDRLRGFCSITFDDCFVVRDLKIIEGASGVFVAMPSRKLTAHCPQCGFKNHLRAGHCNQCGGKIRIPPPAKDADGRSKLYADIAHPINSECREMIQNRVIEDYEEEVERSKQPGYRPSYDDLDAFSESMDVDSPAGGELTQPEPRIESGERGPQGPHSKQQRQPDQPSATSGEEGQFGSGIF